VQIPALPLSCRPFRAPGASSFDSEPHAHPCTIARRPVAGITRLDLSCGLTEFPREIFELADTLEVLNLSGNALSSLPDDLHRLTRMRVLFCSDNLFTELPECVGQCAALTMIGFKANRIRHVPGAALPPLLRWLILTDNCIDNCQRTGRAPVPAKLMLAGNRLQALPAS
jgi:Leucine-rich repeat (LRR) protein